MGFVIATIVDAAAIRPLREVNSDINENESSSHMVNKRSPVINPLFPIKYPVTLLAAILSDVSGVSKILGKVPGIDKLYKTFWVKKSVLSIGK